MCGLGGGMLDSPFRDSETTRLLLLESPYSNHLHADLRWPFWGGGWRSLEDGGIEGWNCQNTMDVEIEKHVFHNIRKPRCVIGYVYTYILISLHKSTSFFFLPKIQVCGGTTWLKVIVWTMNHGFNSHQVRIAFVAVQMRMTTNPTTTQWWMVSLAWSYANLNVPTPWPGCRGMGEMVIFEPAELSIGCHDLIGEIEWTKSGDSILVYPTGCIYKYKSWCESQLVPGISKWIESQPHTMVYWN